MPELSRDTQAIVEAVQDLTRVTLALHGDFSSRSDAIRRLNEFSIPASRIAAILSIAPGDVHSALAKAKKRTTAGISAGRGRAPESPSPSLTSDGLAEEPTRGK